jgi:hypothetical protein
MMLCVNLSSLLEIVTGEAQSRAALLPRVHGQHISTVTSTKQRRVLRTSRAGSAGTGNPES